MFDEDDRPEPNLTQDIMSDRGYYIDPRIFDLDRPRGILSKTDREYLVGEREYEHRQSELNRQQDIRKRVENGLQDFELLARYLDRAQRQKIFDEVDEDKIDHYVTSFISFIYRGTERDTEWLEDVIVRGVFDGITSDENGPLMGDIKSISVDIDIEYEPNVDAVYEKFKQENGGPLTPEEIGLLVRHGKVSPEDLKELDRSDPMDLPAKLERHMDMMKQMVKESDYGELIEDDPREETDKE